MPAERKEERMALGRNCFVGDVQTNRGAIRRADLFSNRVWGWTGGRCSSGTCAVLCKGRVTFSCVLKVLPEREADSLGAGEPRDSPAPGGRWRSQPRAKPRGGSHHLCQHGDEDVSSVSRVDSSWKVGRGEKAFGRLCWRGGQSCCL